MACDHDVKPPRRHGGSGIAGGAAVRLESLVVLLCSAP